MVIIFSSIIINLANPANAQKQVDLSDCSKVTDVTEVVLDSLAKQLGLSPAQKAQVFVWNKSSNRPPFYQSDFSKKPFGCVVTFKTPKGNFQCAGGVFIYSGVYAMHSNDGCWKPVKVD